MKSTILDNRKVGDCWIERHAPSLVVTKFPDGAELVAMTIDPTDVDFARAAALGYPSVEAMNLEHDPAHTFLAARIHGIGWSPVLYAAAHGLVLPNATVKDEECVVLAFQRYLNDGYRDPCLAGLDLPELAAEFKGRFRRERT